MAALRQRMLETRSSDFTPDVPPRAFRPAVGLRGGEPAQRGLLARAVEAQVIPRLVLARRAAQHSAAALTAAERIRISNDVGELADLVLTRDVAIAASFVETVRTRGSSAEALYLDLLAPTARRLGDLWTEDLCNFADVTVALCRLQQVLHVLSPAFQNELAPRQHGRRALLAPAPGDQHSFGLSMVIEFFRRAGWAVSGGAPIAANELVSMVRREAFALIGFSVSCEHRLDGLAAAIHRVRRASRNPAIGVMVGGPIFIEHPELAALVGADATAVDGRQATEQADHLLALLAQPR